MKRTIQIIIVAALLLPLLTQAQDISRNWRTTPPIAGTTPVLYHWEVSAASPILWTAYATTEDTTVSINVPYNWEYIVRVRAADIEGILGDWSPISDPDIAGKPGTCGTPFRF